MFFWNVIRGNIRAVHVKSDIWIGASSKIFSYTGSLIYLRKYGIWIHAEAGDQGKIFQVGKVQKSMLPHFMEVVAAAKLDYSRNESADAAEREKIDPKFDGIMQVETLNNTVEKKDNTNNGEQPRIVP